MPTNGRTRTGRTNDRSKRDHNGDGQAVDKNAATSHPSQRKKTGKHLQKKFDRNAKENKQGTDAREKHEPRTTSSKNELKKVAGSNRSQKSIHNKIDDSADESNNESKNKQMPERAREKTNTDSATKKGNYKVTISDNQTLERSRKSNIDNTKKQEDNDEVSNKDKAFANQMKNDKRDDIMRSTSYEDISSKDDLSKTARNLKRSFNSLHNVHINTYDKNRGPRDTSNEFAKLRDSQISTEGDRATKQENLHYERPIDEASKQPNWVVLLSGLLIISPEEAVDHLLGSEYDGLLAREVVSDDELFIGMKVLAHASRSNTDPNKLKMLTYKIWQPHIIELIKAFSVTVEKYYPDRAERYFWDLAEFLDIYISQKLQIDKVPNLVSACLSEVLVLSYKSYVSEELVNIYRKMQGKIYS